ncbi:epsilon-toxin family protein [Lysinibacillus sp. RSDA_15]|uniref:epsilon-toxin family protein n=1 Tax=Lysinibacillus sp. RSDA_15 TaxID=3391421 RepID=UPI003A4E59D8
MKNKAKVILMGATIGLSLLSSPIAMAANGDSNVKENQSIANFSPIKNSFPDAANGSRFLVNYYGRYLTSNGLGSIGKHPENIDFEVKNTYGKLSMEPQVISQNPLWAGQSDLRNDTDRDQTLSSQEFRKSFSNTTTATTEHGFMFGTETSLTTGIPFLAEGKITLKAEYNFSSSQANETSETVEYVAPSQSIVVPPHTIARVVAVLEIKKIKGEMDIYAEVGLNKEKFGYEELPISSMGGLKWVSLGSIYEEAYNQAKLSGTHEFPDIKIISRSVNNPDYFLASGKGRFESEYGSLFNVQVEYISTKSNEVIKTENLMVSPTIISE